ncbi:MAG: N-acylglucosamine 2-epimerase, partial [Mycobacteriales bacterium]
VLEFLLRHAARAGDRQALGMVEDTCERMARGGMYDQLAGGFARYSVDAQWVVPHFEKMLYDNALLARVYLHLFRATGSPAARRVATDTADFMLADLLTPQRGFASALDADTDGVEGLTYVWTPQQLRDVLGDDDGGWAAALLEVTDTGTFEDGASTLQMLRDPDDVGRWLRVRKQLADSRRLRPQPARDDKIVAAWNGLTIAALAECGALLERPDYVDAAVAAAELLLDLHLVDGRLRRTSREGVVGANAGVLEDYGDVAEGLLVLHQVTGSARWLEAAGALLDTVLEHFGDGAGGFFDTADDAEALVHRPQDPTDNATPSGASAVAGALVSYAALTGSTRHRSAAEAALGQVSGIVSAHPRFAGWSAAVGEAVIAGPLQIALVGGSVDLERAARLAASPGAVVVSGAPDTPGVPLLADRPLVSGAAAAYVCRGFVCDAPVTSVEALAAALANEASSGV